MQWLSHICIGDSTLTYHTTGLLTKSGVRWNIIEVDTGHEAILSMPEQVANIILDSARGFQAKFEDI
jgi:hypothetical protein